MIVAIHQPNYLPWAGYFYKMSQADIFVLLDTAQYSKNSYQNRVQIKTPTGPTWLTQPVSLKEKSFAPTFEIQFADNKWKEKHIRSLQGNYSRAPYFEKFSEELFALIRDPENGLALYNSKLIEWCRNTLGIKTKLVKASDFPSSLTATHRLVELVKKVGGSTYLAGQGARNYQEDDLFALEKIDIKQSDFRPSPYPQIWGDFVPGLSAIDLIFNTGRWI